MQNRSFQAYPITLYSNKGQYKVNWNSTTGMWELRSARGCRLNASRDIFVLARQIQDRDTLIIPKETEHVDWLPDSVFNEIQEYSQLIQTYMLVGADSISHIKSPKCLNKIENLSREQLITLGSIPRQNTLVHPAWYYKTYLGRIHFPLYAEKPFT